MSEMKFDTDGNKLIEVIQDAVRTHKIDVKAGDFTTRAVHRVAEKPLADGLVIHSLTGLVDYINDDIDAETRKRPFVSVDSPVCVTFSNEIGEETDRRFEPVEANADTPTLIFDRYIPKEEMMIMLQSRFVDTDERNTLLEQLGTVVADEELLQADDGVGQMVKTQRGIRRSEDKIVNPNNLRPFRTFTEIDQPESPFIVRLRKDEQSGILVALFEADGGAWRNVARQSIKAFLVENITALDISVIA